VRSFFVICVSVICRDDDAGECLFANPQKTRRLLSTVRKVAEGTIRAPTTHADNAGLTITEEGPEQKEGKSLLSKLYRKWRLESKRIRTVEEVYPDETPERQRKRLVRKTVTHILNLAAVKQHKAQQERISELEKIPLPAPAGLKSLGWRGDERFKNPDVAGGRVIPTAIGKKGSGSVTARAKPVQKRNAKDEAIKLFGELLRDKEWVRRMEVKARDKNNDLRTLRRIETRHARKMERAMHAELSGGGQDTVAVKQPQQQQRRKLDPLRGGGSSSPGREEGHDGAHAGSRAPPQHTIAFNLRLRGGAGIPDWVAALLPTSYDSTSAWLYALVRIALAQTLKLMGMPVPAFLAGEAKGPVPVVKKSEVSSQVKSVIDSARYKEDVLKPLKGQAVVVVTNNVLFKQSDIEQAFLDPEAQAPVIKKEALASIYRLARDSELFLVTQFPHTGLQNLTSFWESRTSPSTDPTNPHGDYYTDKPEALLLQALEDADLPGAGYNMNRTLFCETTEGRGYIARVLGEKAPGGKLMLYVDDNAESVGWFQNVCRNTTVLALKTPDNRGNFATPKHAEKPVVVESISAYFTEEKGK